MTTEQEAEMLIDWLRASVEWQLFGLNLSTVAFAATLFFTYAQCAALAGQNRNIRIARSGESVSTVLFSYMAVVYVAFGYYGVTHHSIGSVVNGAIGFFYILVLVGLYEFGGFSGKEKMLMALFVVAGLMEVMLPWKDTIMTLLLGAAAIPLVQQVLVVRKNKSAGVLSMKYFAVFGASLVFWTAYAFSTGNVPLEIVNPPMFMIVGALFYYWHKYR